MFKKSIINTEFLLMLAFYFSLLTLALPIYHTKPMKNIREFKVSKWRFTCVLCALVCGGAFIYISFRHLENCVATSDCSQSYVTMIEASYAFTLLFIALFALPNSLCNLLTTMSSNLASSPRANKGFLFKVTIKCFSLYVFIIIELLRKSVLEGCVKSQPATLLTAFHYYTKCLIYSFDNLLLTFLFLLEIQFHVLNRQLVLIRSKRKFSQIPALITDHWHTVTILRQVSECLGQFFLGTLVYKQLQVAGMIYFNLLSNLPDDGNDLYQILDTFLPIFILATICFESTEVLLQCHNFGRTLQGYITQKGVVSSGMIHYDMVLSYHQLLNCRSIKITACNFIIIRAGLILKMAAVASTSIIAVVQLNPLPENITITD